MKEFIAYLVKNLVSNPNDVSVASSEIDGMFRIEIRVADEDAGKVIGRGGKTINALRTIGRTVATRLGKKVHIELIQENRDASAPEVVIEEEPALV